MVTNIFYDTDVREILHTMAAQCGVNVISDQTVTGLLTVELIDVPLEEAMQRVLTPFNLTYRWMDGYYIVGLAHPDNPSFPLLTKTELYRPNHVKASDIPKMMSQFYEPYLRVDTDMNTVTLTGSPELIDRMKADLARVDTPPRQIMIEAMVTEVTSDVNREIGIDWGIGGEKIVDVGDTMFFGLETGVTSAARGDPTASAALERVGIKSRGWTGLYRARIRALEDAGKAHIKANPRIATLEGKQALIFVGREEYFTIFTGQIGYTYGQLEVIKTGIALTITPYVSDDTLITLEVEPVVSDVIGSGSTGLPVTSKRSVKTRIRLAQGETAVIGGLKTSNTMENVRKIPLLGSIPILGHLFRHTETSEVESETTILITPTLWEPEATSGE